MHPGCIAGEAARLDTPITFDPALLISDFTLTKDAACSGSALSNWPSSVGSCCRRYKALKRWMGISFSSVCSHTVVTRWQETGRKAFACCHLAGRVQGTRAGGEGENSFSVYPLVGRKRRLNWDQELVYKPGRERRATFVTSAHRCKNFS